MATNIELVQQLYVAYFNRPGDAAGVEFYVGVLNAGASIDAVRADFVKAKEYTDTYAGKSNEAIVNQIYQNIFGHSADVPGLKYYAGLLTGGQISIDLLPSIIAGGAQTTDIEAFASKTTAAAAFTDAIAGDAALRIAYAEGGANAVNTARAFLASVTDAATLATAVADVANVAAGVIPTTTVALTQGLDTLTGGVGNDTFNATEVVTGGVAQSTLSVGDKINGGAGNDTLNIVQTGAFTVPSSVSVTNVETVNLVTATTANVIDTTSWTGVTALNVTGVTAQTVTAAATTDVNVTRSVASGAAIVNGGNNVTVTETGAAAGTVNIGATTAAAGTVTVNSTVSAATGNAITVKGGTTIDITQVAANAVATTTTAGNVVVTGTAATTEVTVTDAAAATQSATVAGHINGTVGITDVNAGSATAAGTIATVTLNNFGAATVNSGALTTLNLSGTGTSVNAGTLGNLTTAANATLALNVTGLTTTGLVSIDDDITTLNVAGATDESTIATLTANGVKTLNISGDAAVELSAHNLGALTSVVVTNTAGASLGTTAIGAGVSFTGGSGDDAVTLSSGYTKAIDLGAGDDTVTYGGAAGTGGSINGGEGTDTIVLTAGAAVTAAGNATFNSKVTGFEVLSITGAASETLDLRLLGNLSDVHVDGATALTLNNFATGGTLTLTDDSTAVTVVVRDADISTGDVFNIAFSNATTTSQDYGSVTVANVETINISTVDAGSASAAVIDAADVVAAAATKIVVSGNNGLDLSGSTAAAVTVFDASGVTGNGTADTAANLAVTYASDNLTATAVVTITGGAGNDTLTGNAAKDTIVGGAGNDRITGGLGIDTLTGGEGSDTFVFASGDAGITGTEKVTDFSIALGGDKLVVGTTSVIADTVTAADLTPVITGAVDLTATVKNGIITLGGADASLVDTIGELKLVFEALDAAGADTAAIAWNGNTYVIADAGGANATDIIQLVGVTGATSLSATDAANSILIG